MLSNLGEFIITIVVYKDGVLVSDSLTCKGPQAFGSVRKIVKNKDGVMVGGAGTTAEVNMLLDWYIDEDEEKPPLQALGLKDFEGIIIEPDGKVYLLDDTIYPFHIKQPCYALGSGADMAYGAMFAGASAEEAVKICIKNSAGCGGKIQKLTL